MAAQKNKVKMAMTTTLMNIIVQLRVQKIQRDCKAKDVRCHLADNDDEIKTFESRAVAESAKHVKSSRINGASVGG